MIKYQPSQYASLILNNVVPAYPCDTDDASAAEIVHDLCIRHGIWPMLARTWLSIVADVCKNSKVLEVMAGGGWITYYLRSKGIKCIAADNYSYMRDGTHVMPPVTRVINMDALGAIHKYQAECDVLLLSWPTYGDMTADALASMWKKRLVYIGESATGCCATESFFDSVQVEEYFNLPNWPSYDDGLYIGRFANV